MSSSPAQGRTTSRDLWITHNLGALHIESTLGLLERGDPCRSSPSGSMITASVRLAVNMRHTRDMDDLHVHPGPGAPHGLRVPVGELVEQFSRASGPGGQGVNTTDSRVELSFDVAQSTALSDAHPASHVALRDSASG